jgi:hypothetical protein
MKKRSKRKGSFLTLVIFLFLLGVVFWCVQKFSTESDTIARIEQYGIVVTTALNMRSGPSMEYAVLEILSNGNKVAILEKYDNNWAKVSISGKTGYVSTDPSYLTIYGVPEKSNKVTSTEPVQQVTVIPNTSNSSLPSGYIPQYALIEAQRNKTDFLAKHSQSALDLKYRFFYNEKGEACLEYTVTPKGGYTWPTLAWIGYTWGNSSGFIGNNETNYTLTKRKTDEAQYRIEERRKDLVFTEIERIVLQIATEYDYDFYSAYGKSVKYSESNVKKAVCDGYATAVSRAFVNHSLVKNVETWSSTSHAWNVVILKDGRKIYCDATWYDGNSIDENGYVVHIPRQNPVDLTFDIDEFNSLGGAMDKATGKLLAVHFALNNVKRK